MRTSRWVRGAPPFAAAVLVVGVVLGTQATHRTPRHRTPSDLAATPSATPSGSQRSASAPPATASIQRSIDATQVAASLSAIAQPASTMIGGANDLLIDGTTVLAATNAGIVRSTDAGATWQLVFSDIAAWSLSRAGAGFVAVGMTATAAGVQAPTFATSADGVQWRVTPLIGPVANGVFPEGTVAATGIGDQAVDVLAADELITAAGGPALRSADGGRSWSPLAIDASSVAAMPDGHTMYATVQGNRSCVYRSVDAGAHWSVLVSSCQNQPLTAIEFVDSQHGFAAGGTPTKYAGSQFLEATADGGRTWQVRWATPYVADGSGRGDGADGVVRLSFADVDHGYALTGGCTGGENGPCGGAVYVTSDGGAHWTPTGQSGNCVVALDDNVALIGVSSPGGGGHLARTADGGKSWTTRTNAGSLSGQRSISGSGSFLVWRTDLGTFSSADGGTTWSSAAGVDSLPPDAQPLLAAPPHDVLAVLPDQVTAWASTDGGRSPRTGSLPGSANSMPLGIGLAPDGKAALIVGVSDDCPTPMLLSKMAQAKPSWTPQTSAPTLYLSDDVGERWRPAGTLPFLVDFNESFAFDGDLMTVVDACGNLEISADLGSSWSAVALTKDDEACSTSLYEKEIWLGCIDSTGSGEIHALHSPDAGGSWARLALPGSDDNWLPINAIAADSAIVADGGALWRTTDGGLHWIESWPALAGEQ
jgi:photosystem II stability/assembly factor-like uncharacterized protein